MEKAKQWLACGYSFMSILICSCSKHHCKATLPNALTKDDHKYGKYMVKLLTTVQ
jgi:hypothetical protein